MTVLRSIAVGAGFEPLASSRLIVDAAVLAHPENIAGESGGTLALIGRVAR